ncbi:hypothetical protein GQ53DRAFT_644701 [Thozetella sp. PMI_491]|nr:hypothetical protein GQ53DRAFT_644701 [Thozetella sp. PMI_491]
MNQQNQPQRGKPGNEGGLEISSISQLSCLPCRTRKLKCDRIKPKCGRCIKLEDECIYPGGRQKQAGKTKKVMELEAKLIRLESLVAASKAESREQPEQNEVSTGPWSRKQDVINTPASANISSLQHYDTPLTRLPGLRLYEPLLAQHIIQDLVDIYFDKLHYAAPMLHRSRYMASLRLPPHLQPPRGLQHIVLALAASTTSNYYYLALPLYQRARAYAMSDEIEGQGEHFTTIAHAQCWTLMANFEAQQTMFSRASTSLARSTRLAQMLDLQGIDRVEELTPRTLAPPQDWVELEERRRTWWVIFSTDRFVHATTGWPTLIRDCDIETLLPASDEAFSSGVAELTGYLTEALQQNGGEYSSFSGRILAAHLFHQTLDHALGDGFNNEPGNYEHGLYWNRHRAIENDLTAMLMLLPSSLRLPGSSRCLNAVFVNVTIHTAVICLHKAASWNIRQFLLPEHLDLLSQVRLLTAAEEIVNILRLITDIKISLMNPLMVFSAYMAAEILLEHFRTTNSHFSVESLNFLLHLMIFAGESNAVARSVALQLTMEMKESDIDLSTIAEVQVAATLVPAFILSNNATGGPISTDTSPSSIVGEGSRFVQCAVLELGLQSSLESPVSSKQPPKS